MYTVQQEVGGVYAKCGYPDPDKLKKPLVYHHYRDVVQGCFLDLSLSDKSQQLITTTENFTLNSQDAQLDRLPPFAYELGMDYRAIESVSEADWRDLPLKDLDVLTSAAVCQAAIYGGAQKRIRLNFDPTPYQFRLFYNPSDGLLPEKLADQPQLAEAFSPYRQIETAILCLPLCGWDEETYQRLFGSLMLARGKWEERWARSLNHNPHRATSRRGSFNSGRRAMRVR